MTVCQETLSIFVSITSSLSSFILIILHSNNHPYLYDVILRSLVSIPNVSIHLFFLGCPIDELHSLPPELVNDVFYYSISSQFLDYCIVYTDYLVSFKSTGFTLYIPCMTLTIIFWLYTLFFIFVFNKRICDNSSSSFN